MPRSDGTQWERTLTMNEDEESALAEMSKRNFEPQRINKYGVWYIIDRH